MKFQHSSLLLLIFSISVFSVGCTSSGMPSIDPIYQATQEKAQTGVDFKLVSINLNTIKKQKHIRNKITSSTGRFAGFGGYQYRIGKQDILSITVWDHPELTIPAGQFRSPTAAGHKVGADGRFFFPYAGKILAAGRTTEQVRKDLEFKLAKFITKPQVGVSIAAFRSQKTYVSGQVNKPGIYEINDSPLTIRDVIAKSGGLNDKAANVALLTHHKQKIHINLDALYRKGDNRQNYTLRGGDALHITEINSSDKVFVMGEVKNPSSFMLNRFGLTLAEVLSEAGGIDEENASPTGIFIVRQENKNDKMPTVYQLKLTAIHSILLAEQFPLRPRDIVYVTATPLTRWNRVISKLLPSFSLAGATKTLTN